MELEIILHLRDDWRCRATVGPQFHRHNRPIYVSSLRGSSFRPGLNLFSNFQPFGVYNPGQIFQTKVMEGPLYVGPCPKNQSHVPTAKVLSYPSRALASFVQIALDEE